MARKDSGRDLLNPLGEENRRAPQQTLETQSSEPAPWLGSGLSKH